MATRKTKNKDKLDPRLHFVVVTAIIVKGNRFLIAKRAGWEKAFPNMWTVPGGKFVFGEYPMEKAKSGYPQKYNAVDWVVRNEVKEEVGLQIHKPEYLCDLVFVRPDGFPVVTLSFWAKYKSGKVKLTDALTDHAWVSVAEAKKYDLIDGIWGELYMVDRILKNKS